MVVQYRTPVRHGTPQQMGPYTFKDQSGAVIDLTIFLEAHLELKFQGQVYSTMYATILTPRTNGQVMVSRCLFTEIGVWDAQFYVIDSLGDKTYGEPVQFIVVANVDDLSITQLPKY